MIQIFIGLPSIFQAINLIISGRAEGALFMIALFLAWIGATLAVATASLIHGSGRISASMLRKSACAAFRLALVDRVQRNSRRAAWG
jgi:hypothetical protein